MGWLNRIGRPPTPAEAASKEPAPESVERASPGVAALLEGVAEDRTHAVLDLGAASASSLQVYSRFARWIRFADLVDAAASRAGVAAALAQIPPQPDCPYDFIFAWDILDRIEPEERPRLIERLAELSASDARLFVVVASSPAGLTHPLRFALVDIDRMRYEPAGDALPPWPPLLPAEVERLLAPFEVLRAFTSKVGLREYVAAKGKKRTKARD